MLSRIAICGARSARVDSRNNADTASVLTGRRAMAQILLADDEAASRELVRKALEADGHVVQIAESGTQAEECFAASIETFDLLVTDINMPGMNGHELVAIARARYPAIHIIMMSGLIEQLDRAKSLNNRPVFTIPKPFTLEQMRQLVRTALGSN